MGAFNIHAEMYSENLMEATMEK